MVSSPVWPIQATSSLVLPAGARFLRELLIPSALGAASGGTAAAARTSLLLVPLEAGVFQDYCRLSVRLAFAFWAAPPGTCAAAGGYSLVWEMWAYLVVCAPLCGRSPHAALSWNGGNRPSCFWHLRAVDLAPRTSSASFRFGAPLSGCQELCHCRRVNGERSPRDEPVPREQQVPLSGRQDRIEM